MLGNGCSSCGGNSDNPLVSLHIMPRATARLVSEREPGRPTGTWSACVYDDVDGVGRATV